MTRISRIANEIRVIRVIRGLNPHLLAARRVGLYRRLVVGSGTRPPGARELALRPADQRSAIQQTGSLRYASARAGCAEAPFDIVASLV